LPLGLLAARGGTAWLSAGSSCCCWAPVGSSRVQTESASQHTRIGPPPVPTQTSNIITAVRTPMRAFCRCMLAQGITWLHRHTLSTCICPHHN
jgi:hypothetical protein